MFNAIPRAELLRFIPYHDFAIFLHLQEILVVVQSLVLLDLPGGPYFHSRHRPTVAIDGQRKIVCFHQHAVERMCKRLVPGGWQDYDGMGEVFAYLNQCKEFERVRLHPDQIGLAFYDDCAKGFWSRRIAEEVLEPITTPKEITLIVLDIALGSCMESSSSGRHSSILDTETRLSSEESSRLRCHSKKKRG